MPTFKPHLVSDIFNVILPGTFDRIRYVPVPRIEYSDYQFDAIVENLVIEATNFFPTNLEVHTDQVHRFRLHKYTDNVHKQIWTIKMSEIQADLKDVAYYIKRKEGFPKITDKGVADFYVGGSGLSAELRVALNDAKGSNNVFKVISCRVKASNLKVHLKQSDYKFLFNIFSGTLLKIMMPVVEKIVSKKIRDTFNQFDSVLYEIQKNVQSTKQHIIDHPEDAQNVFQQYYDAFREYLAEAQSKAEKTKKETTANVAITKQDSIFKDISLPGGISTRATKYKELAKEGETWHSKLFDIGDSDTVTKLPEPKPIRRKSPRKYAGVASRKVRNVTGQDDHGSRDSGVSTTSRSGAGYGKNGTSGRQAYGAGSEAGYDSSATTGSRVSKAGRSKVPSTTTTTGAAKVGSQDGPPVLGNTINQDRLH